MKEFLIGLSIALLVVGLVVGGVMWTVTSADRDRAERIEKCGFYPGDMVVTVLDGLRGMVTYSNGYGVGVRFSADAMRTNVALFGGDGTIEREPYAEVRMGCFEIRHAQ